MAGNALYDVGMRLRAAELHDEGHGRAAIAALLGMRERDRFRHLEGERHL